MPDCPQIHGRCRSVNGLSQHIQATQAALPLYAVRGMLRHPDDARGVRMKSSSRLTQKQSALLAALAWELKASASSAAASMDQTIAKLEESERRMPEIEAMARKRASIEFADLDLDRFAQLLERPAKT